MRRWCRSLCAKSVPLFVRTRSTATRPTTSSPLAAPSVFPTHGSTHSGPYRTLTGIGRRWISALSPIEAGTAAAIASPAAPPSPGEIHHVVRRAAQLGAWERAIRLFHGAMGLRCVPLAETYAVVLESTLRGGGWAAAAALATGLATSPQSNRTLHHAVADMLLLPLLRAADTSREGKTERRSAKEGLIAFLSAAQHAGVQLAPRHRCAAWEALLEEGRAADVVSAAAASERNLKWVDSAREHSLLMQAAAESGSWPLALALTTALDAGDGPYSPPGPPFAPVSVAGLADTLAQLLKAFTVALGANTVAAAHVVVREKAVPWERAVALAVELMPHIPTAEGSAAVENAIENLRRCVASGGSDDNCNTSTADAHYATLLAEVAAMADGPELVEAIRSRIPDVRTAQGVLRAGKAAMALDVRQAVFMAHLRASARVLAASPSLLVAMDVRCAFADTFPTPWRVVQSPPPQQVIGMTTQSGAWQDGCNYAWLYVVASATALFTGGTSDRLELTAGLLHYVNYVATVAPSTATVTTMAARRAVDAARPSLIAFAAALESSASSHVATDSVFAKETLRAVLTAVTRDSRICALSSPTEVVPRLLAAVINGTGIAMQAALLLKRSLMLLQPSLALLYLRPETALELLCTAAKAQSHPLLWAAALRYYRRLQRLGWATRETQARLEEGLAAGAAASNENDCRATALAATAAYARLQWRWDGSLDATRRTALPLLVAHGCWAEVASLLALLRSVMPTLTDAENQMAMYAQRAVAVAAVREAIQCRDPAALWVAWQQAEAGVTMREERGDPSAKGWWLPAREAAAAAGLLLTADDMQAEADTLLARHCPLCSDTATAAATTGASSAPSSIHEVSVYLYHQVQRCHMTSAQAMRVIPTFLREMTLDWQPAACREARLLWGCAVAVGCADAVKGYALLAETLLNAARVDQQQHYHCPDPQYALEDGSDASPPLVDASALASATWVLRIVATTLLPAAVRAITAGEVVTTAKTAGMFPGKDGGDVALFCWLIRSLGAVAVIAGVDPSQGVTIHGSANSSSCTILSAWAKALSRIPSGPLQAVAARSALQLLLQALRKNVLIIPFCLVEAAVKGAYLRAPEWLAVATALQRCGQAEMGVTRMDGEEGTTLSTAFAAVVACTVNSLVALGETEAALACFMRACDPLGHGQGTKPPFMALSVEDALVLALTTQEKRLINRRSATVAAQLPLSDSTRMRGAAAMEAFLAAGAWREAYILLIEALSCPDHGLEAPLVCCVLAEAAAHGPWRLAMDGWARLLRAAPHLDWAGLPVAPSATGALLALLEAMQRQGAGPAAILRVVAALQQEGVGIPLEAAAVDVIASAVVAAPRITQHERRGVIAAVHAAAQWQGEQRVTALVHAMRTVTEAVDSDGVLGEETSTVSASVLEELWRRRVAPPTGQQAAGRLAAERAAAAFSSLPRLTPHQLEELAAAAPVLLRASPLHLERAASAVLGGRWGPFELLDLLDCNRAAVRALLAQKQQPSSCVSEVAVAHLASNRSLVAQLADAWRRWQPASGAMGSIPRRASGDREEGFVTVIAQTLFDSCISQGMACQLWERCRPDAMALATQRWPAAAEVELRDATYARWGRPPEKLCTAPHLSRAAIAHYWSVHHAVLLPELQLGPRELGCLAAYMPEVEAVVTQVGADGHVRRDWWGSEAFHEVVALVHATHFAGQGTATATAAGTMLTNPFAHRAAHDIAIVYSLAWRQLRRLHTQLEKDAHGRQLYRRDPATARRAATVVTTTAEAREQRTESEPAAVTRLDMVAALRHLRPVLSTAGRVSSTSVLAMVPLMVRAAQMDDPRATPAVLTDRVCAALGRPSANDARTRAMVQCEANKVITEEAATAEANHMEGTPSQPLVASTAVIHSLPLRALVGIARWCTANRRQVPASASLAILEELKALSTFPLLPLLSAREASLMARAAAREQLAVWLSLSAAGETGSISALPYMEPAHVTAMEKLLCASPASVRDLPQKCRSSR